MGRSTVGGRADAIAARALRWAPLPPLPSSPMAALAQSPAPVRLASRADVAKLHQLLVTSARAQLRVC